MASCMSLISSTHVLSQRAGDLHHTVCGLAIAVADMPPGLIAQAPGAATCPRCQSMLQRAQAGQVPREQSLDPSGLVERLVALLNANDTNRIEEVLGGALLRALSARRISRLHQLFPQWHATIDELIADPRNAVLRYRVGFRDAFGLFGATGASAKTGQAVVLRLADRRITDACPIVDDFAFWSGLAQAGASTCAQCVPHTNTDQGSTLDSHHP